MTMQRTPLLLSTLLDRAALMAPNEEIVTMTATGTIRETYAQARGRACQLAHALKASGIEIGDRVATFMWNGHRHIEAYHAVPSMGAVLHTLNIRLGPDDLEYIINHAGDRIILADADLLAALEPLAGQLPTVEKIVVCSDNPWSSSLPNTVDYEDFIAGHGEDYEWPIIDENSPLGLCYTSGTTGKPKGVMYTHRSTYLHTMAIAMTDTMNLSAVDCLCGIVPMFHAMGWGLPFAALMLGCKQALPHRFMVPDRLLDLFESEQVTISAGVPTIWQGVRASLEAEPERWSLTSISRLTCGGSAPPLELLRWYWDTLGVEMIQGWGMTETNPVASIARRVGKRNQRNLNIDQQFVNINKAGLTLPGLEVGIVDESFNFLPHDGEAVGELLVRGPWICSEYYNDPQPDKFHDGWLVTGDVASIDPEQYIVITDRAKDLIKSGGEWISSVDMENHIAALPSVRMAAVVAQPHPKWDERPVAVVVCDEPGEAVRDEVLAHCAMHYAKWQLPDDVLFHASIPLTSTGKMDKKKVRATLADDGYKLPDLR
ncbi:MAG: long-chain fatty acid--CoA ligase [Chromatiales bacterium]|jgi:acyl-CoA synthetase (AMP-forming)/AMP-acid ligase II|nr:long-chain fatty acid--CoA ligase [Chromatiales bacterium]